MMSLRKSFSETSAPRPAPNLQTLLARVLELLIMGNTMLKRDRRIFGEARRFAAAARIASFAMLDNFSRTPQSTYLADSSNVAAVPLDAELKVLVGIKTLRVDRKFQP